VPAVGWVRRHRVWTAAIAAAVLLLAAGTGGLLVLLLGSGGTPVNVAEAVRAFREKGSSAPRPGLAVPGVYVYGTTGSERVSFLGLSRTYPERTPMTYSNGSCGIDISWDPFREHVEAFTLCPGPGGALDMTSSRTTEEVGGISSVDTIECGPGSYLRPPGAAAGQTWGSTCHDQAGSEVRLAGRVIGFGDLSVGGKPVPSVHTRATLYYSDSEQGSAPGDYWFALRGALILREVESADISEGSSPLGSVRYHESLTLSLLSTEPHR
jgi:hypothetical protein